MTREEAKEILISTLRDINSDSEGFEYTTEQFTEAMLIAIEELSRPSLPSNIDEASLKVYPKMSRLSEPHGVIPADNKTHYLGDANEENRVAFRAGAEWMAEQGYSQEETVEDKSLEIGYGVLPGITPIINLPDSFKPGDKVIVQIRKKEE